MAYHKFTDKDRERIESLLRDGKNLDEIAQTVGASYHGVYAFVRRHGLIDNYQLPKHWTEEELQLLEDNYGCIPMKQLAKLIGRDAQAISSKAVKLGLFTRKEIAAMNRVPKPKQQVSEVYVPPKRPKIAIDDSFVRRR